jgi:hypothetical protein
MPNDDIINEILKGFNNKSLDGVFPKLDTHSNIALQIYLTWLSSIVVQLKGRFLN